MRANRLSPSGSDGIRGLSRRGPSPGIPSRRSPLVWFLVIAGIAFVFRLIHLVQLRHNDPLFFTPQMDALYHHQWALAIAAGREFIADAFFRAPLYPYFLGLLYKLFGANLMVVRIIQALIGSATCGLVYLLARRLFAEPQAPSRKSGLHPSSFILYPSDVVPLIAGFVMAAYPLAIWYDSDLLLEGMLTFLILFGLVLLLRSRDTDRQWWLSGIAFGLAAIARPNVLAFLAVLPVWLFIEYGLGVRERSSRLSGKAAAPMPQSTTVQTTRSRPRRNSAWTRLLLVWGPAALVILPVTIRNYVVSRQFVPIAWQAGTNFYIGNSPESDGHTAIVPGTRGSWWGGYNDVKRLAEEAAGRPLKGAEIDRYWLGRGFEFWHRQPGKALGLLLRKTFLWIAGHEVGNETDLYVVKRYSFINYLFFRSRFLKFPFGILLPLGLAGVWLTRRQWRRLLPVYLFVVTYSLSFIAFFVCSRYRTPVVPIAAIFGAIGLVGLIGHMGVPGRQRTVAIVIAVVAFLLLNANLAGAGREARPDQNHFAAAYGLLRLGKQVEALAEVRRALEHDSAPNVLSFEASLLQRKGDFAGAERAARAAVRLHPLEADAYLEFGNVFANRGELDSAAHYYEVALQRDPYTLLACINRGNVALNTRDYATARHYYEAALKIQPTSVEATFYVGLCDYYEGKVAEAHARWQQVIKLDPTFTRAQQALEQLK